MNLNLTTLAASLQSNKWMINSADHQNLAVTIESYIKDPTSIPKSNVEFEANDFSTGEGNIACIHVNGILVKGCSPEEEEVLGLCNVDTISEALDKAANDPTIDEIVMVFSSPGGETTGIEELGRKIASIDSIKPIYGWSETRSCSASYWLMSQCRQIGITPSTEVGSIGVYMQIEDKSSMLEKAGVLIQTIFSGKFKTMGQPTRKLTKEETDILQADVESLHNKFKQTILSKRQVAPEYMEGLSYEGLAAQEAGLADVCVDNIAEFLTSTNNIDMIKTSKITKPKADTNVPIIQAPDLSKQAEATPKKEEKEMPGVPGVQEDEAVAPKKMGGDYCECPSCKHTFKLEEKHVSKLEEAEEGEDEAEPKKEEPKAEDESEEKKKMEEDEESDKKKATVPEVKKKAEMPSMDQWRIATGTPKQANAFYDASYAFLTTVKK